MAPKSGPRVLSTPGNLANLLPTGTVLSFQALVPSFSNNGACLAAHKYLTLCTFVFFSLACFLSSFTDSFVGNDGKLYYGIAKRRDFYIFNKREDDNRGDDDDAKDNKAEVVDDEEMEKKQTKRNHDENYYRGVNLEKYSISLIDFVHAFASLLVFLVFATSNFSNSGVQSCFFPKAGPNADVLTINLPLGVGALSSFLFMIFPTTRRGIGYADNGPSRAPRKKKPAAPSPGKKPLTQALSACEFQLSSGNFSKREDSGGPNMVYI